MTIAISSQVARQGREPTKNRRNGTGAWRTYFIGQHRRGRIENNPQAYLVDMDVHAIIPAHFHQVDQFQVFVAGSGSLGRNSVPIVALHYVDHHTAYGPVNAGPCGLSIFTFRSQSDPGAIYLDRSDYTDFLRPSKKRYLLAENIELSIEPVLQSRRDVAIENVLKEFVDDDGLGVCMLRLGASMKIKGPDPSVTGGQYYLVLNGSLQFGDIEYPIWSTVYAGPGDAPVEVCAGTRGLETLILSFPRP